MSAGFRHTLTVARIETVPLRARGGVSPAMALGTMPSRPALLIRIEEANGAFGWGEVWANFPPRAALHKAHLIEDVVAPVLIGAALTEPREATDRLRAALSTYALHVGQPMVLEHVLAGIDMALWDLALRHEGRSFAAHMGLRAPSAETYASSINADDIEAAIPRHAALGQRHFKIKIGFEGAGGDLARRAAAILPDGASLMVDANQTWDLARARAALGALEDLAPLFAEEPLRADAPLSDWEALAAATPIPLAGGENVYGIEGFRRLASAGMRVLQPDVAKWGGVTGALDLAADMPVGTSLWPHFMGSAVGQMAALCVAAHAGAVCEMDANANALRSDLCGEMAPRQGRVALPEAPGLVAPPRPEALTAFAEPTGAAP